MEQRLPSPLPIIGTDQFGFTEREVLQALSDAKNNVLVLRGDLGSSDESNRESLQKEVAFAEEGVRVLSVSPGGVLARVKAMYERTVKLASSGVETKQLALQVGEEFPDLFKYYRLLRMKPWGYRLGQEVGMAMARKQMENRRRG